MTQRLWPGDPSSLRCLLQASKDFLSAVEGFLALGAVFLDGDLQSVFGAMGALLAHLHLAWDPSSSIPMGSFVSLIPSKL